MSAVQIRSTEIVPIELQIIDGDESKFPLATIIDETNTIIATRNLSHISGGLYKPDTNFIMSTNVFITVQILVYEDTGRSILSTEIGGDSDIFILGEDSVMIKGSEVITASIEESEVITASVEDNEEVIAIEEECIIIGFVEDNLDSVIGIIEECVITGEVND